MLITSFLAYKFVYKINLNIVEIYKNLLIITLKFA